MKKWPVTMFIVLLYLAAGFYPFEWSPPSRIRVLLSRGEIHSVRTSLVHNDGVSIATGGVRLSRPGIAVPSRPTSWLTVAIEESTFSADLVVRPFLLLQYGPARMLTISQDQWKRNLTIAQDGSDLIVRVRTPLTDENGEPPFRVANVFSPSDTTQIGLTIADGTLDVQIDGEGVLSASLPPDALSRWSPHYRFALGNELTFNRPWLGEILTAYVGSGAGRIDYIVPGVLKAPDPFVVEYVRTFTLVPFAGREESPARRASDWLVNFVGFVVLGLLVIHIWRPGSAVLSATLLCAALSVSIEIGQFFFGVRIPSTDDLILNTAGGWLGAWLAKRVMRVSTDESLV